MLRATGLVGEVCKLTPQVEFLLLHGHLRLKLGHANLRSDVCGVLHLGDVDSRLGLELLDLCLQFTQLKLRLLHGHLRLHGLGFCLLWRRRLLTSEHANALSQLLLTGQVAVLNDGIVRDSHPDLPHVERLSELHFVEAIPSRRRCYHNVIFTQGQVVNDAPLGGHRVNDHRLTGLERVILVGDHDDPLFGVEALNQVEHLLREVVPGLTQVIQRHLNHDDAAILLGLDGYARHLSAVRPQHGVVDAADGFDV